MTELFVVASPTEGGELAARQIAASMMSAGPKFVLGVATGSTPQSIWKALAARGQTLDFSTVRAFALDEYWDIAEGHPESYRAVVEREITGPLGLNPGQVRVPGDDGKDPETPSRYEATIRAAGGIDLQVLGIGRNGHIAFNEPGASLASRCRVARLTQQTRRDNARFFADPGEVPSYCITQGIGTILEARHLILAAYGPDKAEALAAALEGPVTSAVPASALQLHPEVTVIADGAASSRLKHTGNYLAAGEL